MTRKSFTLEQQQVAYMLNVDSRSVRTWCKREIDPLPVAERGGRGQPHRYDPADCVAWYLRNELANLGLGDSEALNLEAERAKLTRLQAMKVQLDLDERNGALVPVSAARELLEAVLSTFKTRILGVPSKLAPLLLGLTSPARAQEIVQGHLYESLDELSRLNCADLGAEKS